MGREVRDLNDLLPSEQVKINHLLAYFRQRVGPKGQRMDVEGFRRGIIDRFEKIGFKVTVDIFEDIEKPGLYIPTLTYMERLIPLDRDQQVHEVVHDVAGTGKEGWIREDGSIKSPSKQVPVSKKVGK